MNGAHLLAFLLGATGGVMGMAMIAHVRLTRWQAKAARYVRRVRGC